MNRMKNTYKFIGLFALLALLCMGCSKDDSSTDNEDVFMRCKMNGKLVEFKYRVNANDKPADWNKIHFVTLGGNEGQDMLSPSFGIQLLSDEGAKEMSYVVANSSGPDLKGQYYIQNVVDGKVVSSTGFVGDGSDGSNFTLNITSLTKWGVKGTFSGLLVGDASVIKVTEGEFSAPYNKN